MARFSSNGSRLEQLNAVGIPVESRSVEDERPDVRDEELLRLLLLHVFEAEFGELLESISRPRLSSLLDAVQYLGNGRTVRPVFRRRDRIQSAEDEIK